MNDVPVQQLPDLELEWEEVAAAIFAAKGITSGYWRVGMKMSFGALTADWQAQGGMLPTAMFGINSIALFKANEAGPMVFDAATAGKKRQPASKAAAKKVAANTAPVKKTGRVSLLRATSK